MKVLNATFTDHNPLFAPLKKFPDALSENERYSKSDFVFEVRGKVYFVYLNFS